MKRIFLTVGFLLLLLFVVLQMRMYISNAEENSLILSSSFIYSKQTYLTYSAYSQKQEKQKQTQITPNLLYVWSFGLFCDVLHIPHTQKSRAIFSLFWFFVLGFLLFKIYPLITRYFPVDQFLIFGLSSFIIIWLWILSSLWKIPTSYLGSLCFFGIGYYLILKSELQERKNLKLLLIGGYFLGLSFLWKEQTLFFFLVAPLFFRFTNNKKQNMQKTVQFLNIALFFAIILVSWQIFLTKNSGIQGVNFFSQIKITLWFQHFEFIRWLKMLFFLPITYFFMVLWVYFIKSGQYRNVASIPNRIFIISFIYFLIMSVVYSPYGISKISAVLVYLVPLISFYVLFQFYHYSRKNSFTIMIKRGFGILSICFTVLCIFLGKSIVSTPTTDWATLHKTLYSSNNMIYLPNTYTWVSNDFPSTGNFLSFSEQAATGYLLSNFSPKKFLKDISTKEIGIILYSRENKNSIEWNSFFDQYSWDKPIVDSLGHTFFMVKNVENNNLQIFLREDLFTKYSRIEHE